MATHTALFILSFDITGLVKRTSCRPNATRNNANSTPPREQVCDETHIDGISWPFRVTNGEDGFEDVG
jgi:hypothetical protein